MLFPAANCCLNLVRLLLNATFALGFVLTGIHTGLAALLLPLCLPLAMSPDTWSVITNPGGILLMVTGTVKALLIALMLTGLVTPLAVTVVAARGLGLVFSRRSATASASVAQYLLLFAVAWVVVWAVLLPRSQELLIAGLLSSLVAAIGALYQLSRSALQPSASGNTREYEGVPRNGPFVGEPLNPPQSAPAAKDASGKNDGYARRLLD